MQRSLGLPWLWREKMYENMKRRKLVLLRHDLLCTRRPPPCFVCRLASLVLPSGTFPRQDLHPCHVTSLQFFGLFSHRRRHHSFSQRQRTSSRHGGSCRVCIALLVTCNFIYLFRVSFFFSLSIWQLPCCLFVKNRKSSDCVFL